MKVISKYIQYDQLCKKVAFPKDWFIFGLGDFLRGSIALYGICERLNIPFFIDYSEHPIRDFLTGDSPYAPVPPKCLMAHQSKEFEAILEQSRNLDETFVTYANCQLIHPISDACKEYMRSALQPNRVLNQQIEKTLVEHELIKGEYNCISIRMGDASFNTENQNSEKYERVAQKVLSMLSATSKCHAPNIVVSDDSGICEYLNRRFNFKVRNTKPCHLGRVDFGDENIADTLVDFFLLRHSAAIIHYSVHHWISGFCDWTSKLYDIPLFAHTST